MESPLRAGLRIDGDARLILALILAVAIGFSLALFGSGGSIITLPVLVYATGVPAHEAVGMSLAVVGGTSLTASAMNARGGLVHAKAAVLFSVTGIFGALVAAPVLMLLFAGLMIAVAVAAMLAGRYFAGRVAVEHLRRAFAWFVLAVATFVVAKNWAVFS